MYFWYSSAVKKKKKRIVKWNDEEMLYENIDE